MTTAGRRADFAKCLWFYQGVDHIRVDRVAEYVKKLGFSRDAGFGAAALFQSTIRFYQVAVAVSEIYFRELAVCCALRHRFLMWCKTVPI
jgi:hypothetical protein